MTPLRMTNFRLDDAMIAALHRIKSKHGIPVSEQVRRALTVWVESNGETLPAARPKQTEETTLMERRIRAKAQRMGFSVSKSRSAESLDNHGLFMLAKQTGPRKGNWRSRHVALGERFDATLEDIEQYLNNQK